MKTIPLRSARTNRFAKNLALTAGIALVCAQAWGQGAATALEPVNEPPSVAVAQVVNATPRLWFVELASPPAADGTPVATLRAEKQAFRAAARQAGLKFTERYAFDTLWNGFSLRVPQSQWLALTRLPGVKNVYPVAAVALPAPEALSAPDLITALAMTGADVAQNSLGLTGAGVRVGVIDTGVDYDHPDLGGGGVPGGTAFPSARVVAGYDFVGDAYNADDPSSVRVPDPFPDDCAGHGTHVAGIIGARGSVTGVAPGVVFGAYRVFGCNGSADSDVILAAMERALADGMQVVNMSLGSAFQWPEYPTAAASDRLVNRGVVVVCSIGNSGANGLYSASAPGVGKKAIGVASFDNTHLNLNTFTISPDGRTVGYVPAEGAPPPPVSGTAPMARTGTTNSTADACAPLPAGSLTGKVALIRRGGCTFYTKAFNAMSAGAIGVVLYNNAAGILNPTVAGSPPITIPVVAITRADGALIDSRLAGGPVTMTWTDHVISIPNPTGNLISSFSSYGLAPDLSLKPDLGAPGGSIRSTYPLELGGAANLSGTSMSSPHVAGAVALLFEASPRTPAQAVRSILQNNAVPKPWWGNPSLGLLDNVHRQGAGMLRIDNAILATARVEPATLALGESQSGPATRTLTVQNKGTGTVTFEVSHQPALATGTNTFSPSFSDAATILTASASTLTLAPGASASVDVTITADPTLADRSLYGGYVVFTPQGGGLPCRAPYAGFKGDYQSIRVLTPTPAGFPWLAKLVDGSLTNQPGGATFTLVDDDLPIIAAHFEHQSRRVRFEVFDANTGRPWHRIGEIQYFERNSTSTEFFAFGWDGITATGRRLIAVPNGQYVIKLSVLKALGDADNPADWETWTSPTITLARP